MRQGGTVLWRTTSKIEVVEPFCNYHGHAKEERVSFNMPLEVAELLESCVVSWWKRAGEDWPPSQGFANWHLDGAPFSTPLTKELLAPDVASLAKELTVWLQVWYHTGCEPRVLQSRTYASGLAACFT